MLGKVIEFYEASEAYTVLYCAAYYMTQAALLLLIILYAVNLFSLSPHPRRTAFFSVFATALFLSSFVLDAILFLAFDISSESTPVKTAVFRPVFYLGFIGLCAYFFFTRQTKD